MTPQRHSRRIGTDPVSARIAAKRRYRRTRRTNLATEDAAVLSFLSEVLVGDDAWSLTEVQRLIAFREQSASSTERETRFEDAETFQF